MAKSVRTYKRKQKMKALDVLAIILLSVGGINWGLSLFGVNLVEMIFRLPLLVNIVYGAVGISGLYGLWFVVRYIARGLR
jgi:uncharacterized membrane protein YuzA (DUF378 family)